MPQKHRLSDVCEERNCVIIAAILVISREFTHPKVFGASAVGMKCRPKFLVVTYSAGRLLFILITKSDQDVVIIIYKRLYAICHGTFTIRNATPKQF